MRAALALLVALGLLVAVDAGVQVRHSAAVTPEAAIPVQFATNSQDTVFGNLTTQTVAQVANVTLPALGGTVKALRLVNNTLEWSMRLRVTSATGITALETITVGLLNNATASTVALTSSTTYPVTTSAITLGVGAAANITAASGVAGGCGGLGGDCNMSIELLFDPTGAATSPEFTYTVSMELT